MPAKKGKTITKAVKEILTSKMGSKWGKLHGKVYKGKEKVK